MQNNDNHGVYDLNTLVNYDPDIIEYIDAEIGSRFERDSDVSFRKLLPDE
jgi:hypothetical protein